MPTPVGAPAFRMCFFDRVSPMAVGAALVALLLAGEHLTVARWGTSRIALTFFTFNGVISCLLGILGLLDVLDG